MMSSIKVSQISVITMSFVCEIKKISNIRATKMFRRVLYADSLLGACEKMNWETFESKL